MEAQVPALASIGGGILHALDLAFSMFWEILWALILGFALSGAVQALVSKEEMRRLLPDDSPRTLTVANNPNKRSDPGDALCPARHPITCVLPMCLRLALVNA